jgi:Ni/Co efflux regulator RcnB
MAMNIVKKTLAALLFAALISGSGVAFAEKGGHGHDHHEHKHKEKEHKSHKHENKTKYVQKIRLRDSDRIIIREYLVKEYHAKCPPGLAKKHNGCLPPGHAKYYYTLGQPLPRAIVVRQVPEPLFMQLTPPPLGYRYVMVDNDVLLVSESTGVVMDVISLLSAIAK